MLSIQQPIDLISISLFNVLSYRKDEEEYYNLVKDWNKTLIINVKELYPVTVIFEGTEIKFEPGETKKADLKVTMGLQTMLDVAYGRKNAIMSVLKREIKMKGIFRVGVVLKFMKIFLKSMKMVVEDPEIYYFEKERITR